MNKILDKITRSIESGSYKSTPSAKIASDILSILDQENVRIVKEIELPKRQQYFGLKSLSSSLQVKEEIANGAYEEAQQDTLKAFNESLERLI